MYGNTVDIHLEPAYLRLSCLDRFWQTSFMASDCFSSGHIIGHEYVNI